MAVGDALHIVGFRMGEEVFGVPVTAVHEIMRVPGITAVPGTSDFMPGVINLRGNVIPVLDLRKRFGRSVIENHKKNRVLVTEVQTKLVGVIVDEASEVLKIPLSEVSPPPNVFEEGKVNYVTGVGKVNNRLFLLVDLTKVLQKGELKHVEISCEQRSQ